MVVSQQRSTLVLELFDAYYERVYAFLRKSTTPDVAEDLAQEVFLRLMQHPELERLEISISYLLKIGHNLLRRRFSRAARLRELLEERIHREGGDPELGNSKLGDSGDGPTAVGMTDGVLETALGLLGRDEQDAIRLIVCEGKSYQHAAEALGVSVTTINNWKHRGIVKLRKYIEEAGEATALVAEEAAASPRRLPRRIPRVETATDFSAETMTLKPRSRSTIRWQSRSDEVA
jgi:RNA polymerase sigma-70 factor (ECF subfamily)